MSAIEAWRSARTLGLSENQEIIVLPAWLIDYRAAANRYLPPVIKCEFDGGILVGADSDARSATGEQCGLKTSGLVSINFTTRSELAMNYETWSRYCLSYDVERTDTVFILPVVKVAQMRSLAIHAEWQVVRPIIRRMARHKIPYVITRLKGEYGHSMPVFTPSDIHEMIEDYVLSRRVNSLIDRSIKLRTFQKVGPIHYYATSIRRDLTDVISTYVGDVKNGPTVRRIAKTMQPECFDQLRELVNARYRDPMNDDRITRAILLGASGGSRTCQRLAGLDFSETEDDQEWPPRVSYVR